MRDSMSALASIYVQRVKIEVHELERAEVASTTLLCMNLHVFSRKRT